MSTYVHIRLTVVRRTRRKVAASGAPTERGQRTQRALMDAALKLMEGGRSFNSLSMREVTAEAGIVPTAFYRHYADMNELGLAMVDDVGRTLRPLLRQARMEGASASDIIRGSVLVYQKYVAEHPRHFLVAAGERHGGSPVIREAIRAEIEQFIDEMADDLEQLRLLPDMERPTLRNVCDLVVNTMLSAASEILDSRRASAKARHQQQENFVQQLRVIFLGAATWREQAARA